MAIPQTPTRNTESLSASLAVTPVTSAQAARIGRPPEAWSTADVTAYVLEEIIRIHGPQLPSRDVKSTLEGFCERFSIPVAVRIARAVFEVYGGMWQGAPVTWKRFGEGHDSFFSLPILDALA